VTKTNRFTLIATFLLGVLLYTILRFAADLNIAWDGSVLQPPPATDNTRAPTQPRIATATDLRAALDDHGIESGIESGIDSRAAIDGYADWSDARGFTGDNRLFGTPDIAPTDAFAAGNETVLIARSDAGDVAASQALAARMLFIDPFNAIEYFRRAAEQGSTFALLRIGSVLEALDAAGADAAIAGHAQRQRVADLTERGVGNSLRLTALGYVMTAIRDGGAPIVDHTLLTWLDRLIDESDNDELVAVCEWSERTLVDIAKGRVRWGKPAITTVAPPVFFAIPNLAERLPCVQTAYPIETLLDLANCSVTEVRNAADEALDLYICSLEQEISGGPIG